MTAVRKLREAKKWTQDHLAAATGLSLRTIQRAESGKKVSKESLICLASALDTQVDQIQPEPSNKLGLLITCTAVLVFGGLWVSWSLYGHNYESQNMWHINYRMFLITFSMLSGVFWGLVGFTLFDLRSTLWSSFMLYLGGLFVIFSCFNFYPFIQYPFDQYSAAIPWMITGGSLSLLLTLGTLWVHGELRSVLRFSGS